MQNNLLTQYFEGLLEGGAKNAKPTYIFLLLKKVQLSSYILRMKTHILSWISIGSMFWLPSWGWRKESNPTYIFSSLKTESIIILHFKNAKAHSKLDFYWLNILSDFLEGRGTNIKPNYFYFYLKKKSIITLHLKNAKTTF